MHLRSGKRYQPYNRQCCQQNHHDRPHTSTPPTRSFSTRLPLEIQMMIIKEALHHPDLSRQYILSYVRVCRAWSSEIERDTSLYTTLQTRLMHLAARHNNVEALDIMISGYGVDVNS